MPVDRACESVGIDLGTTFSAMAYMGKELIPQMVVTSSGKTLVEPSVIYFDDEDVLVGETALEDAEDADRLAQFVKVHMGDEWRREFKGHTYTPESLSAIILGHMVQQASKVIGDVKSAIITVPAYFTEKRRRATQQAGEIAGLNVIGTLNEPMAATLAYGLHERSEEQVVAVYDLGGGTFDVTIVRITPGEIVELATNGNRQLGGKNWDDRLIDFIVEELRKTHHVDVQNDPQGMHDLRLACEKAKRKLSGKKKTRIDVRACDLSHTFEITRDQFEELTADLLESTRMTTEMALEDAKLGWGQVSRVVLVGGSVNMPAVRQMLEEASGKPVVMEKNPVMLVALGAAIYAHMLDTGNAIKTLKQKPPTVRFVTAHGVGIGTKDPSTREWRNSVLIPKNTQVPVTKIETFSTAEAVTPRTEIKIPITQGDTTDFELAERLGEGVISGFPGEEPAGQKVEVAMEFDETGRLHAHAVYVNTGQEINLDIDVSGILKPEEVEEEKKHLRDIGLLKVYAPDDENGTAGDGTPE